MELSKMTIPDKLKMCFIFFTAEIFVKKKTITINK